MEQEHFKIQLIGTGAAPHASKHGITFQSANEDKLSFQPFLNGTPALNSSTISIDGAPKLVICSTIAEYIGKEFTYTNSETGVEVQITLPGCDLNIATV
tara:strand:+ start:131 stop:427 length:297 start_codon:yes stop_codon:yes gene_type:complete